MDTVYMIFAAAANLAGIIFLYVIFSVLGLWLTGLFAGAPVKMSKLISMRVRGMPCRNIMVARARAAAACLNVSIDQLERHYLAGGDPDNAVGKIVDAKNDGVAMTWEQACEADLAQKDED